MEPWRKVWREGIAPQLTDAELSLLRDAIESNDRRLTQQQTTKPLPLEVNADSDCEGADILGYAAMVSSNKPTVRAVESSWMRLCERADDLLGNEDSLRDFIRWYDDVPREEMRRELLREVSNELTIRQATTDAHWSEYDRLHA